MIDLFAVRGGRRRYPSIAELIDATGDCWEWTGTRSPLGYGQVGRTVNGRKIKVPTHRVVWEALVGPIPEGLEMDHLCRNPPCCNPDHLEVVTHLENMRRSGATKHNGLWHAAKTHCPQGHEYTEVNTYYSKTSGRMCKVCRREREVAKRRADGIPLRGQATHCRRGHEWTPENIYMTPKGRECRTCRGRRPPR